jgi:hypothetical protein
VNPKGSFVRAKRFLHHGLLRSSSSVCPCRESLFRTSRTVSGAVSLRKSSGCFDRLCSSVHAARACFVRHVPCQVRSPSVRVQVNLRLLNAHIYTARWRYPSTNSRVTDQSNLVRNSSSGNRSRPNFVYTRNLLIEESNSSVGINRIW